MLQLKFMELEASKVIGQSCSQGEATTCGPSTNCSNVNGINVSIHV
jgi:hypothetical protein